MKSTIVANKLRGYQKTNIICHVDINETLEQDDIPHTLLGQFCALENAFKSVMRLLDYAFPNSGSDVGKYYTNYAKFETLKR